ncbi:hypothetical protein ILUMI_12766, partial [Ignelater luminosus]
MQFGLTYHQILEFAHSSGLRFNRRVPNNWVLSNATGVDWMKEFIKKYPDLSLPEYGVVLAVPEIVAPKGCKQVGQTVSGERSEQVTFVGIVTASGETFPPVYVFLRARYKKEFLNGAPPGSIVLTVSTDKG